MSGFWRGADFSHLRPVSEDRLAQLRRKGEEIRRIRTREDVETAVKAMSPAERRTADLLYDDIHHDRAGWWFDKANWCWRHGSEPLPAWVRERNAKGRGPNGPNRNYKLIFRPDSQPPPR